MTDTLNRRKFLRGSAVAGAAALATPAIAESHGTTLKMQAAWGGGIFLENAQSFANRVNEMSDGSLTIEVLAVDSVVKTSQMQDAVHRGVLDAAHYVPSYWYGKSKTASLFGTGPCFGWSSQEVLGWIYAGGGQELFDELMAELRLNVVSFFNSPMPAQPLGWFNKQITDASQMKGLKYRTVGLAADLMQELGAKVTQLPGGEIVPAMDRGVIDAFEFNNPTSDRRFGAQDVAKNYMMGSFHQAMEFFEIVFNKRKHDALPADLKAILRYAAEAASSSNWWTAMDNYSKDFEALGTVDKVNITRTPKSIFDAQMKAWDVISKKLSDEDPFFKKVVDSQKAWSKRVAKYMFYNEADYKVGYEHIHGKLGF